MSAPPQCNTRGKGGKNKQQGSPTNSAGSAALQGTPEVPANVTQDNTKTAVGPSGYAPARIPATIPRSDSVRTCTPSIRSTRSNDSRRSQHNSNDIARALINNQDFMAA